MPLAPGKNTLTFTPWDARGCPGNTTTINATHKSCVKPDAGPSMINAALKGTVTAKKAPKTGSNSLVANGKTSTTAVYQEGWGYGNVDLWVLVTLPKAHEVTRIALRWKHKKDAGCHYGGKYHLLYSAAPKLPEPSLTSGKWKTIKDENAGEGGLDEFSFSSTTLMSGVLLWMRSNGCTDLGETFELAELEIWAKNPDAQPPITPDSCGK